MNLIKLKNRKRSLTTSLNASLYRTGDGFVCTPAGKLTELEYMRVVISNRDVAFPDYRVLPVRA